MLGMVLAAGRGTRLRPLTLERPKPGVPYGFAPLAQVSVERLAAFGVEEITLNTHHLGERLPGLLEPHTPAGARLRFVHEETLLGTGGGIHHALASQDDDALVLNGDIVFRPDLDAAVAHHRALGAIATMIVRPSPDAVALGAIGVREGRVVSLLAKSHADGVAPFMFTGGHVLSARAIAALPANGCVVREGYTRWLAAGETIGAVVDTAPWSDLGTLPRYLDANLALCREAAYPHPSAVLDAPARGSLIGAGARVEATIEDCLVWPGAVVREPRRRCVITPERVVEVPA